MVDKEILLFLVLRSVMYDAVSLKSFYKYGCISKIKKVPRGIRGEKLSKDMASSRN